MNVRQLSCLVLILVACCEGARAQDAKPAPESAEAQWLFELLLPYGGPQEFTRGMEALKPELLGPAVWQRLTKMVRTTSTRDLVENRPPSDETETAIRLLGFVQNDDAVAAIALYLKHQSTQVRVLAADSLRITGNPKAVPSLVAALLEVEQQLPAQLTANAKTEAALATIRSYFEALSALRNEDALAALDASLARLKNRYEMSDAARALLRQLQDVRETGRNYRPDSKARCRC